MEKYNYEFCIEKALKNVIKGILQDTEKEGLVADQHFYITFQTNKKNVDIPEYLYDEYPNQMTIILQHQFYDLKVEDNHFSVLLTFKNAPEKITISFDAVVEFIDPSQNFCLKFDPEKISDKKIVGQKDLPAPIFAPPKEKMIIPKDSNIVTLDAFRKQKD